MISRENPASRSQISAGYVGSAGHAVQIDILNNLRAAMVGVTLGFGPALSRTLPRFTTVGFFDRVDPDFLKPRPDWPDCRPMVRTIVLTSRLGSVDTVKARI